MNKITDKKLVTGYSILFMTLYMVSYISRINYGAIISEVVCDTGISKSLLSMALTGSFISYGAGQIISGKLGDKYQPKSLITIGLFITSLINLAMPFCKSPYIMLVVWTINGFAQSFMWPPLVRIMSTIFTAGDYSKACLVTSWGSSIGTIVVYLISPVLITMWGWKSVFFVASLMALFMIFFWQKYCIKIESTPKSTEKAENKNSLSVLFSPLMISVMVAIICQGALRDGVTTWMPSYISETYNFSTKISILTSVILPIFSIFSFQIASSIYRRMIKNPLTCAGAIFAFGLISAVVMTLFSGGNAIISIVGSAFLTGAMHGVNLILICMLPSFFYKYGNISTVSGVLNACTYIGSAISTYGIALISENFGWTFTLLSWCLIAGLGTSLCFINAQTWKNFIGK